MRRLAGRLVLPIERLRAGARLLVSARARSWWAAAFAIAVVAWTFRRLNDEFLHNPLGFDESFFVWGGWCIRKGLVPYRDFIEFKPPLLFLTHALALAWYGYDAFQYRWFFVWFPLASLIALTLALWTRRIDGLCILAFVLAIVHLWTNAGLHDTALSDSESIGLTYYFFGLACLVARVRFAGWLKALGGAFLLAAVLSKEPYLPAVALTFVGCVILDARPETWRADAWRMLKWAALGAGVLSALLVLYLGPTGGLRAYLTMVRGYWALFHDPRHSYCALAGDFRPADTFLKTLWQQFEQAREVFLNVDRVGFLLPFVVLTVVYLPRRSLLLALAGVGAFVGGLWAVTASNCQWPHYYNMTLSGLFFLLLLGLDAIACRIWSPAVRRSVGWALLAGVVVMIGPRVKAELDHPPREFGDSNVEAVPGAIKFVRENSAPTDRIVTTGPPAFYVQTDRLPAVRESTFQDNLMGAYPGNTPEERLSHLRDELERSRPKIVYFDPGSFESGRQLHYDLVVKPYLAAHHYLEKRPRLWVRPD
jgi:hypothetical protein